MTKQEILDRQKFEDLVCTESALPWGDKRHFARLILRHARTYQHLQEDNCNGCGTYYNEPQEQFAKRQDRFEKRVAHREEMIERRLREIASELGAGFAIDFGGDPRGCTVKLKLPSGTNNDWERSAWCVPSACYE